MKLAPLAAALMLAGPGLADTFEEVKITRRLSRGIPEAAPDARFVVTSRELLNVRGEEVLFVEPLDALTSGVALFEHRARSRSRRSGSAPVWAPTGRSSA